jgi:hypothetical protein
VRVDSERHGNSQLGAKTNGRARTSRGEDEAVEASFARLLRELEPAFAELLRRFASSPARSPLARAARQAVRCEE